MMWLPRRIWTPVAETYKVPPLPCAMMYWLGLLMVRELRVRSPSRLMVAGALVLLRRLRKRASLGRALAGVQLARFPHDPPPSTFQALFARSLSTPPEFMRA